MIGRFEWTVADENGPYQILESLDGVFRIDDSPGHAVQFGSLKQAQSSLAALVKRDNESSD